MYGMKKSDEHPISIGSFVSYIVSNNSSALSRTCPSQLFKKKT